MVLSDSSERRKLVVGASRKDGGQLLLGDLRLARFPGELVVALEEKPLLLLLAGPRAHAHEMPAAFQALALQRELEVAFGISLVKVPL